MRYISIQRHKSSCGPIAIINAIKHLGGQMTHEDIHTFKSTGWDKHWGMDNKDLTKNLKILDIKFKKKNHPTLKDIDLALKRGNSVILLYKIYTEGSSWGHYAFIDEDCGDHFNAYNSIKEGINILPKEVLGSWFRSAKRWGDNRPIMWEIGK